MSLKKILLIAGVIVILTLMLQNMQVVTVKILFWDISMSRALLYPLIFFMGFVLGWSVSFIRKKRSTFD